MLRSLRPCLTCGTLTAYPIRCKPCQRARAREASSVGRQWRGPRWKQVSERLRQQWRDAGFGCVDAHEGNCRGRIQADHLGTYGPYVPRCAYHNNRKH